MSYKEIILLLCLNFTINCLLVRSHELPKQNHGHYSFTSLQEALNGESLISDDVDRLLSKLHFWNCSDNSGKTDHRKVKSV